MKIKVVEIIVVILCLAAITFAAWYFAELTGEDAEYRGRWAAGEIGRMRFERQLRHEQEIDVNEEAGN